MTIEAITPESVHPPVAAYSHGVVTHGVGRTLYISGQLGIAKDGRTPANFTEQAEICWQNIVAILNAAGMTAENLVKTTSYLTQIEKTAELGAIRASFIGDARPASTVIGVQALARPEFHIEIEAIAFSK
ncbi:RidA family protein [Rhizobium leguminosarum]|uniref:RidA family protein n=1 Tax=Rhizobium leguminosarum TaxID=384 RepID=UPI001C980374|nr:RidA family protein [Rhizobium leguminosarum]MBY5538255.1 RidA family protein [Rhizobium leguminosarum]